MTAARKLNRISVEDYLAGEWISPVKREYVAGVPYAMPEFTNLHNRIAANTLAAVAVRLRGNRCRAFNSNTKIRVHYPDEVRFYYPDLSVVRRQNPDDDTFQDQPALLFEVLSEATRRTDQGEKSVAYLTIPSLAAYLLIEQDSATVTVWRRTKQGFVREDYEGIDQVVPLAEVEIELPLAEIYEGVTLE